MTTQPQDNLQDIARDAALAGERLAQLLAASSFTPEQKEAWASVVPLMSASDLARFAALLEQNAGQQVAHELEDVILAAKAAKMKHDMGVTARQQAVVQELAEVEKEVRSLEG